MSRRTKAFTLIEILVVVAIIGILASLVIPAVIDALTSGIEVQCKNNMKQVFYAMMRYADKHHGKFPWAGPDKQPYEHLQILINKRYITDPRILVTDAHPGDVAATRGPNGRIILKENNVSFTIYSKPITRTMDGLTIVMTNKSVGEGNGFKDGYCQVELNTSARFVEGDKLPEGVIHVEVEKKTGKAE